MPNQKSIPTKTKLCYFLKIVGKIRSDNTAHDKLNHFF